MISRKTSILCYAKSDCGKSTQFRYLAEYIWKKHKRKSRLIALDRGSLWGPSQDLVDEGIVVPIEFQTASEFNPMAIMRKLRRGEVPRGGIINMPTRVQSNGKVQYKSNTEWLSWDQQPEEDRPMLIGVDSITSFATSFMSDAKQKNIRMGNESGAAPREEEGEISGTNTQTHYGDAHLEVLDMINAIQALPIEIAYFTALEDAGTDDSSGTKKIALGPATVGKAIVSVIPQRVQNCFHLQSEGVAAAKKVQAWYSNHPSDMPTLQWPSKIGLLPHELPEFWKAYPKGFIPLSLDKGIAEFLEWRDAVREKKEKVK